MRGIIVKTNPEGHFAPDQSSVALAQRVGELERHIDAVEQQLEEALRFQDEMRTVLAIVCGALEVVTK